MNHLLPILVLMIFPAMVVTAALKDLTSYTIPNWISLTLIAGFPVAAVTFGLPIGAVGLHAALGAGALIAGMAMFAVGWIGGGDAKLFAGAALWLGWPAGLSYLFMTCLAGGALAALLIGLRSMRFRPLVAAGPDWVVRLCEPGGSVPYGVAIAIGALAAFPLSTLVLGH